MTKILNRIFLKLILYFKLIYDNILLLKSINLNEKRGFLIAKIYEPIPDFYIKVPLFIETRERGWRFDVLVSKTESTIASGLSDKDSEIKRLIVYIIQLPKDSNNVCKLYIKKTESFIIIIYRVRESI